MPNIFGCYQIMKLKKNFHRKVPVKAYKSFTNPFCHYVPSHIFLFSSKPNREKQLSQHK